MIIKRKDLTLLGLEPTGSLSNHMTMGIVEVASLAGPVAAGPAVTMMSTLKH
jgi:hypothetical protein